MLKTSYYLIEQIRNIVFIKLVPVGIKFKKNTITELACACEKPLSAFFHLSSLRVLLNSKYFIIYIQNELNIYKK